MKTRTLSWVLCAGMGAWALVASPVLLAAPPCKGPNKNDPGCGEEAEPPPPPAAQVDSVTVDWFNQALVVRGSNLDGGATFGLGGAAGPLVTAGVTPTELTIPFSADLAGEVLAQGSYRLLVDGAEQLTVFIDSQIIDPAATGCPCAVDWAAELGGLWGSPNADCLEIEGPGTNDPADISGTVLSVPGDPTAYPHYPIGASFYPGQPEDSVCRLVQVNADASTVDLVNLRINENQQADCRTELAANACASITPLP